ncbi:MAG TPA: hypothetical protein VK862_12740 [Afifellaceae bacterium]|nr:hypothetical protein [Afifellaceae bacterium]
MHCLRIYADSDGHSHLADCAWPMHEGDFTPPSPAGYFISEMAEADRVLMMHHPAGYRDEWHCVPAPVLGIVLAGRVRVRTSDGNERLLRPGDQFLATDLDGTGHRMDAVDAESYDLALVVLDTVPRPLEAAGK